MQLSYNISFTIASLVICIILLIVVSVQYSSTNSVNKGYKSFLIASITLFAVDILTVITNDLSHKIPVPLNMFLNALFFLSGAMVALFFLYYCVSVALARSSKKIKRRYIVTNLVILGSYVISLIVNHFTGFYFHFRKHRESLFWP